MRIIKAFEIRQHYSMKLAIDAMHRAFSSLSSLGDLGLIREKCISGNTEEELNARMMEIIHIIHDSIGAGLKGTEYADRVLQQQSHLIRNAENEGRIRESVVNRIIENVSALMESKSAMEVIVAAPTAGSCGTVGGSLKAVADNLGNSDDELVNAYSSAIMSVSGYDAVIPLDQVLQTVSDVGKTMPSCLKCTGKGGLAVTETALKIKNRLSEL